MNAQCWIWLTLLCTHGGPCMHYLFFTDFFLLFFYFSTLDCQGVVLVLVMGLFSDKAEAVMREAEVETSATEHVTINKVIKFVKNEPSRIVFPKLELHSLKLRTYADASFNNLPKGGSQGGHIVFLMDRFQKSLPLSWNSTRIKRVVRSTLAAETLSLSEGCDTAFFLSNLIDEIFPTNTHPFVTVEAITDNQSLHDIVRTTKQIQDKRLRVDVSSIREMAERNEIEVIWVDKEKQIADVLTKKGAPCSMLCQTLQGGHLPKI